MQMTLLLDYDDNLAPSEPLAFEGCCQVVNEALASKGVAYRFTTAELLKGFVGSSFRRIMLELSTRFGFTLSETELEAFVLQEEERVIATLAERLEPSHGANTVLARYHGKRTMAVVSSSALRRLRVCLKRTKQEEFFPENHVFSAATSLSTPSSKPDPAVYLHALEQLKVSASQCVAVEDSKSGVKAAVAAGILVVGYVGCLPVEEQNERIEALLALGAHKVIGHWDEFPAVLEELEAAR